ncbi:hypothetical protein EG329_007652 [Mollisiaceae sp. DMI_Dod_QoI]|nr:hypothetical protein EG329_007652 [Helotiales sp. DMI_Dod_QoI]
MSTSLSHLASRPRLQNQAVPSNGAAGSSTEELYQYELLPSDEHFRILELLPEKPTTTGGGGKGSESGVRCRLHTEKLADAEDKYAAISYVWGDANDTVPIVCDGKIIEVTVNLADALSHIREHTQNRFVWADAVCINQEDNTEKGHQVKKMGKVYENAAEVLVWLGNDSEGIAEDCFNLIRDTNEYLDHQYEIYGGVNAIPIFTKACPISLDRLRWNKVTKLILMPWFKRLWVLQEAALAKQCMLHWGNNQLSMAELCETCYFFHYRQDLLNLIGTVRAGRIVNIFNAQRTYRTVKTWMGTKPLIKGMLEKPLSNSSFLAVLDTGRPLKASFEVDRVYAFLGNPLARKCGEDELLVEPDYSKSTQEVYLETARSLLSNPREAPYLLAMIDHSSSECVEGITRGSDDILPSWVPRWNERQLLCPMSRPSFWYKAGGLGRRLNAAVQLDKSLLLPAIIFDRIVWTSGIIEEKNLSLSPDRWNNGTEILKKPFIDLLFTWVQQAFPKYCHDRYSDIFSNDTLSIKDAFSLTLMGHYPEKEKGLFDLAEHRKEFEAYLRAARQVASTLSAQTQASDARAALGGRSPFKFAADLFYIHNRRFAITESGRFGLIPWLAKRDDVCCICPGMHVPLILGPRQDGRYGLVGDSYIHGVMAGEVMEQLEKGEVKLEDIILV